MLKEEHISSLPSLDPCRTFGKEEGRGLRIKTAALTMTY